MSNTVDGKHTPQLDFDLIDEALRVLFLDCQQKLSKPELLGDLQLKMYEQFKDKSLSHRLYLDDNKAKIQEAVNNYYSLKEQNQKLREALTRVTNCNDIATAREYAREALDK